MIATNATVSMVFTAIKTQIVIVLNLSSCGKNKCLLVNLLEFLRGDFTHIHHNWVFLWCVSIAHWIHLNIGHSCTWVKTRLDSMLLLINEWNSLTGRAHATANFKNNMRHNVREHVENEHDQVCVRHFSEKFARQENRCDCQDVRNIATKPMHHVEYPPMLRVRMATQQRANHLHQHEEVGYGANNRMWIRLLIINYVCLKRRGRAAWLAENKLTPDHPPTWTNISTAEMSAQVTTLAMIPRCNC